MERRYHVIRSNRKTLSMSISSEGEVIIRAPRRCPNAYIDAFVNEKWSWVESHMPQVQSRLQARAAYALRPGQTLPLLGEERPVRLSPDASVRFQNGAFFVPELPFEQLRPMIQKLYQKIGLQYLPPRVAARAWEMGLSYGAVRMSHANRRWASCAANGDLNFSWRLMMAPPEDVDYVIVHELAHRVYFDHSPAFWALVERYCPDWRAHKASLTELHGRLLNENWV